MVFMPCFVEAMPFNKTEVPFELTGSSLLVFGMVSQDIHQTIKIPIIVVDSFFSYIKGVYEVSPGSDSAFFLAARPCKPITGDNSKKSNTDPYENKDGLGVHLFVLLLMLSVAILPWVCKDGDILGLFIAFCKHHKYLKWLAYDIWSE